MWSPLLVFICFSAVSGCFFIFLVGSVGGTFNERLWFLIFSLRQSVNQI